MHIYMTRLLAEKMLSGMDVAPKNKWIGIGLEISERG